MKKWTRTWLVVLLVVLVAAVLVVVWQPWASTGDPYEASGDMSFRERVDAAEKAKGKPLEAGEVLAMLPAAVAHMYTAASKMGMERVGFHAVLKDQYGDAVTDAVVRYSIMGSLLGDYTPGRVVSDTDGRILIAGSGGGITIMGISRPGYVFTSHECYSDLECNFAADDFFAAADKQPYEKTWYDHKTPETAYTFKMHKLGYVDGVVTGSVFTLAPRNGSEWQTYMFAPERKRSDEPGAPGQLRARILDRSDDNWKIEIQAVNGGIQLAPKDDAYMSIAPESGYQETFVFECKRDGNCNQGNDRRFYFYSNGGKEYGAMVVSIMQGVGGHYRINTKGGRDLNMADLKQFDLNGLYR